MGLNLPLLLTNSQTLDSWSAVGQFSPPMGTERSTATTTTTTHVNSVGGTGVQLPNLSAFPPTSVSSLHELSVGSRSLFGGSSNNSEPNASPQKSMETAEIEDNSKVVEQQTTRTDSLHSPAENMAKQTTPNNSSTPLRCTDGAAENEVVFATNASPIPNVNTNEAHLQHHHLPLRHLPAHQHIHPPLKSSRHMQDLEDLDIKQELVDYFHPHANVSTSLPADSRRSYSSAEEMRASAEDYAQDLRVAAAKGLNFGSFVLPRNLRPPRSSSPTESLEEKYTPLNMRKIAANSSTHAAGNMLMNSLLSHESMSEDTNTPTNSGRLQRTTSQENASAAAAAALYAESLTNRDDCDFVGSNVTIKLRAMDRTQRIIAEKLISEVLFYGQFNELERSARIQPK